MCPPQVSRAALAIVLLQVLQSSALLLQCDFFSLSLLLQASLTFQGPLLVGPKACLCSHAEH